MKKRTRRIEIWPRKPREMDTMSYSFKKLPRGLLHYGISIFDYNLAPNVESEINWLSGQVTSMHTLKTMTRHEEISYFSDQQL